MQSACCTAFKSAKKGGLPCKATPVPGFDRCHQHLYEPCTARSTCTGTSSGGPPCRQVAALNNALCPFHLVAAARDRGLPPPQPGETLKAQGACVQDRRKAVQPPSREAVQSPLQKVRQPPLQKVRQPPLQKPETQVESRKKEPTTRSLTLTSHSMIEKMIKNMISPSFLKLTCKGLTVAGTILRHAAEAELQVVAIVCKDCKLWRLEDDTDPLVVRVPDYGCTYYDVEVVDELQLGADERCSCPEGRLDDPLEGVSTPAFRQEILPDASLGWATGDVLKAQVAAKWFLHEGKPPNVHTLVWKQLAASTRSTHMRWLKMLKCLPSNLQHAPLGSAAVHLVLMEAKSAGWQSWGTVASALSSIASALRRLPQYVCSTQSIDLSKDPIFDAAQKRAQQLAKITKRFSFAMAMTIVHYESIRANTKCHVVRLFLLLGWLFAARIGDLRQVIGADVFFGDVCEGRQMLSLTFRGGQRSGVLGTVYDLHHHRRGRCKDLGGSYQCARSHQHVIQYGGSTKTLNQSGGGGTGPEVRSTWSATTFGQYRSHKRGVEAPFRPPATGHPHALPGMGTF